MDRLLKSKFKIKEKIGENPFSLTYKGTTLSGEHPVIIKIYKRGTLNSVLIKTMKQKVKILEELKHSGIAKLMDGDYGWQGFYYVREYLTGQNLNDHVKNKKLTSDDALSIIYEIASTISFSHKQGIIHGSLKPNNIFIDEQNKIKLADFIIEGEVKESMPQKAVYILESSDYASPEEIYGSPAREPSDIYAVGTILFELLYGHVPYKNNPGQKLSGHIPQIPSTPKYLEDILAKALHKDPILRFRSIDEMKESVKNRTIIEFREKLDLPDVTLENTMRAEEKATITIKKDQKRSFFLLWIVLLAVVAGIIYSILNTIILAGQ